MSSTTCSDPCTGLQQMSFWCSDNPCNIGQGEAPFKCECEVNGGAVAGIVIACVAVVIAITCAVCCYFYHRNKRLQQVAVTNGEAVTVAPGAVAPPGTYVYNPNAGGAMMPMQTVTVVSAVPPNYGYPQAATTGGYPQAMVVNGQLQQAYGYSPQAAPAPNVAYGYPPQAVNGAVPPPPNPHVVFYGSGGAAPPPPPLVYGNGTSTSAEMSPITKL